MSLSVGDKTADGFLISQFLQRFYMNTSPLIAVIGGTGKSGTYLVQQLLQQGFRLKLLIREAALRSLPVFYNDLSVEIIDGNVRDYETVRRLTQGCDAVVSTLGLGIPNSEPTIFTQSTLHVLRAMKEWGIERYIVTTGLNVDTPFDCKGPKTQFSTEWMRTNFPRSTADKQREYEILSLSQVKWTLVRLPLIELTDNRKPVLVSLEDMLGDSISATDLAFFLIHQLVDHTYWQKAPFIGSV